jgi:hypothetical protein
MDDQRKQASVIAVAIFAARDLAQEWNGGRSPRAIAARQPTQSRKPNSSSTASSANSNGVPAQTPTAICNAVTPSVRAGHVAQTSLPQLSSW